MERSYRQALGQHFLADPGVVARIVEALGPTARDLVCEIGAGPGVLTRALAPRAGRLVALEIDPALQAALASAVRAWPTVARVEVRLADARTFPYAELAALRPDPGGRVLVAGNLPYSVSKPILEALLDARAALDEAVLMLQREVAARLTAPPGGGAYGALTLYWRLWADVELVEIVPPSAFRPPPAVESAVIHVTFRRTPRVGGLDERAFTRVVRAAFAQRRKTLANALRGGGLGTAPRVTGALVAAGIDPGRRAETLRLDEFARLAAFLGGSEPA